MKIRILYVVAVALSCLSMSCSKSSDPGSTNDDPHDVVPTDTVAPVLVINTPAANQVYNSGNTILITGRITDDLGLYRGYIRIMNDATGSELKYQGYEIHGIRSYDFTLSHTSSVTVAADYTITVSFEDHGLNVTTRSVKVRMIP